jgi:hypothetical protein
MTTVFSEGSNFPEAVEYMVRHYSSKSKARFDGNAL